MVSACLCCNTTGTAALVVGDCSTASSDIGYCSARFNDSLEEIFDYGKERKFQQRLEWKAMNKAPGKARAKSKSFFGHGSVNRFNNRIRGNHVRHMRPSE